MEEIKKKLKEQAIEKHGEISPCGFFKNLDECFIIEEKHIFFWFNDKFNSTKVLVHKFN